MTEEMATEIIQNSKNDLEEIADSIAAAYDIVKLKETYSEELNRKITRKYLLACYYKTQMILTALDYVKNEEEKGKTRQQMPINTTIWR